MIEGSCMEQFRKLRPDVKDYLVRNLEDTEYYVKLNCERPFKNNPQLLEEYKGHERCLSFVCGKIMEIESNDLYDPILFLETMDFIKSIMDCFGGSEDETE
jgi:hypothetical protein